MMNGHASNEDLLEHFTLSAEDFAQMGGKTEESLLGFAILMKMFQRDGKFPDCLEDIDSMIIDYLAKQLNIDSSTAQSYRIDSRAARYHRSSIREMCGFHQSTDSDNRKILSWLTALLYGQDMKYVTLYDILYRRYRELKLEPPSKDKMESMIRSAIHRSEQDLYRKIFSKISSASKHEIDRFLDHESSDMNLAELKSDPGRMGIESLLKEIEKLTQLRAIGIDENTFAGVSPKLVARFKQRLTSETLHEINRHPKNIRYTLFSAFILVRSHQVTDNLVDLFINIVHKINAKSEQKVEKELLKDIRKISGKTGMLYQIAEASLEDPDGIVREVVFNVVNEKTLKDLVREYKASGPAFKNRVHTVMRGSYQSHYRRMIPEIISALEFNSNNSIHRPVIDGISLIKKYKGKKNIYFNEDEQVPIKGVVKNEWLDLVIEESDTGNKRINRINYELALVKALRERLRCKEIWVSGASKYRNPDDDLPSDFEKNRSQYYADLNLPIDQGLFIQGLQTSLDKALSNLNQSIPGNSKVKILTKKGGWISVTPLERQPETKNLIRLKTDIGHRWPMTSLLDILKETALRTKFTKHFKGAGNREVLTEETLHRRLLICLFGLGTNTGLKRVSTTIPGESHQDLRYVKRKFIDKDSIRNAIIEISNEILRTRMHSIWGDATTAVASDSKKFGSWDQNLMTEWHIRYGGRGVMIYWHVDKNSLCIYSQLKTCSSSEVAAMIEGLIKHCTEMKVEKNYVDTHGQSEVAFAVCHLLGFKLMPRLANIATQKLYRNAAGDINSFPNLKPILTRPIKWDLISQQYDELVKYASALRTGTAETEAILKRFTKNNLKHPTYRAFCELGKVIKTIFLCNYLQNEEVRREINAGLNVVENWNSANGFIFFGKNSEIASNRLDEQELSVAALHLLQISLVYINTLMIQRVLSEKEWFESMKEEDFRGLSPLFYAHINPYGVFKLNMSERLAIEIA